MPELILASQSPRRREILNFFAAPFIQVSSDFDETQVPFRGDPVAFVSEVSKRKVLCLQERYLDHPILAADTIVYRDNRLFMKPDSLEEAFLMLSELSGKEHSVFTGVSVAYGDKYFTEVEESRVFFSRSH